MSTVYILPTFKEAVGHWRFRGNLLDKSYSGSHLSNVGITSGDYTTGYTEDGITAVQIGLSKYGYISNGSADHFVMLSGNFSVEMWIKTSTSTSIYPIKHSFGTFYTGWHIEIVADGYPNITLGDGGTSWDSYTLDDTIDDGAWHHVAFVVDRTANEIYGYIDGVVDTSSPHTLTNVSGSLGNPMQPLYVGLSITDTIDLDELLVTKKTFSTAEILQHYQGHPDPTIISYSGSADETSNTVTTTLNSFDIKLKHTCNHLLSSGQYSLAACPRCLGTGIYYDIKFDESGRPTLLSIEDKLIQSLEKMVLTSSNKFHDNVAVDLRGRIGSLAGEVENIIKYDIQQAIASLKQNQRSVTNLSGRAQISSLDSIDVVKLSPTSYKYVIEITTITGESLELTGNVNVAT